jgi:hypothetical protein
MELLPHDQCVFHKAGSSTNARYSILSDNPDLVALFKGHLAKNEMWFQYQTDSVTDEDRTVMYRQDAPEMAVVRKMRWYADFAQQQFRETKFYPSNTDQTKRLDPNYGYINPISGKGDFANILLQIRQNNNFDFAKALFADHHAHPGEIYCMCINNKTFLIQGYDRDGKPLTSSDPNQFFTIECQNGVIKKQPALAKTDALSMKTDEPKKAIQVYFFSKPGQDSSIQWLRRFSLILLWAGLLVAGLFWYVSQKTDKPQNVKDMSVVGVVAAVLFIVAWYMIAA